MAHHAHTHTHTLSLSLSLSLSTRSFSIMFRSMQHADQFQPKHSPTRTVTWQRHLIRPGMAHCNLLGAAARVDKGTASEKDRHTHTERERERERKNQKIRPPRMVYSVFRSPVRAGLSYTSVKATNCPATLPDALTSLRPRCYLRPQSSGDDVCTVRVLQR